MSDVVSAVFFGARDDSWQQVSWPEVVKAMQSFLGRIEQLLTDGPAGDIIAPKLYAAGEPPAELLPALRDLGARQVRLTEALIHQVQGPARAAAAYSAHTGTVDGQSQYL